MMIIILIPVIFFLSNSVMLFHAKPLFTYHCWRSSLLVSSTLFALAIALSTEILSVFHVLHWYALVVFWSGFTVASLCGLFIYFKERIVSYRVTVKIQRDFNVFYIGSITCIAIILVIIALIAPPNNWDSMGYRLSRVVHWMQNQSVAHYPTHSLRSLYVSPFTEYVFTQIYILTGSDRLLNLVQWCSMIGSCIGVSLIARELGACKTFQMLASLICVTIPMGILQATSTQTDYFNGFMFVSLVFYVLRFKVSPKLFPTMLIGISLGEAILAKATAYIYGFSFMIWFGIMLLTARIRFKQKFTFALITVVGLLVLNGGNYIRNYTLFKLPLGVHKKYNNIRLANEVFTLKSLTSNVIRNVAFHIQVPSHKIRALEKIRQVEENAIKKIHDILQFDISDPRTTYGESQFHLRPMSTHEDLAGNTVHFVLIVFCLVLICIRYQKIKQWDLFIYLCCLIFSFLLLCLYVKWSPWRSRYHLVLFVLATPFISMVMKKTLPNRLKKLIAVLLVLQSTLWVFHNYTRPIIAKHNIFNTSRIEQYFKNRPELMKNYIAISEEIVKNDPKKIGLIIGGDDWEYPLWILTDAFKKGIQIRHTDVKNISSTLEKSNEQYDAILTIKNEQNIIKIE